MTDQFEPAEFDEWAPTYDESVGPGTGFPFDGYAEVLEMIFARAASGPGQTVLDLGTGTGNLAALFAARGWRVWGLDFSAEMLARAREKLPAAELAQADLRAEWPPAFQRRFDQIVSGYTFHHFPQSEKVALIRRLLNERLARGGSVLIGDIAFADAAAEEAARQVLGDKWEQEYFWLADEAVSACAAAGIRAEFWPVSFCAGIFRMTPEEPNDQP